MKRANWVDHLEIRGRSRESERKDPPLRVMTQWPQYSPYLARISDALWILASRCPPIERCCHSPYPRSPVRQRGSRTRTRRAVSRSFGCASRWSPPTETHPHGRISHSKFCVPPCAADARTCRSPHGDEGPPSSLPGGRSSPGYAGYQAGLGRLGPSDPPVPAPPSDGSEPGAAAM